MTDLKSMGVAELLLEVLKHKGTPSNPGITWRESFDELARRLREQEASAQNLRKIYDDEITTLRHRAKIAEQRGHLILE